MLKSLKKAIKYISEADDIPKDRIRMFTYFKNLHERRIITDGDLFYWIDRYIPTAFDKTDDKYYKDFEKAKEDRGFMESEILQLKTEIDTKFRKKPALRDLVADFTNGIYRNAKRKPWYSRYYYTILSEFNDDKKLYVLNAAITVKQRMKLLGIYYELNKHDRAEEILWN